MIGCQLSSRLALYASNSMNILFLLCIIHGLATVTIHTWIAATLQTDRHKKEEEQIICSSSILSVLRKV